MEPIVLFESLESTQINLGNNLYASLDIVGKARGIANRFAQDYLMSRSLVLLGQQKLHPWIVS